MHKVEVIKMGQLVKTLFILNLDGWDSHRPSIRIYMQEFEAHMLLLETVKFH